MTHYAFDAETVRDLIAGLIRSRLREHTFPSAMIGMVAEAMERAHEDLLERALDDDRRADSAAKHAPLLESAAARLREAEKMQRARDEAHYDSEGYFSVVIPYTEDRNEWTPAEPTGPFSTLCRGAFRTLAMAHEWAREFIPGRPYTVRFTPGIDLDGE